MSGVERGSEKTSHSESDSHRHSAEKDRSRHRSDRDRRSEGDRSRHRSDYERRSYEQRASFHRSDREHRHESSRDDRERRHESKRDDRERRNESSRDRRRDRDDRDSRDDRHRSSRRYDNFGRDHQRRQSSRSQSPPPPGSEGNGHEPEPAPIEKPNYTPTGLLARAQNTVVSTHAKAGTVAKETHIRKYTEPADAAPFAPSVRKISEQTKYEGATSQYRLVRFAKRDNTPLENIRLDQQTSYLAGTDPVLAHIPLSNTKSAEEQHAVIQYRLKISMDKYGDNHRQIKPYLIDLDSEDGTVLNGDLIPSSRYVELRHKDVLEFGKDSDEYVFIQETTS